jgi:hypothetical protein
MAISVIRDSFSPQNEKPVSAPAPAGFESWLLLTYPGMRKFAGALVMG